MAWVRGWRCLVLAAATIVLFACGPRLTRTDAAEPARDAVPAQRERETAAAGDPEEGEGTLFVDEPAVLAALEENGASFGEMLAGTGARKLDNGRLAALTRYRSLVDVVEADIAEIRRVDRAAGVSVAGSSHRLFDVRWLRSPAARFELVGLVNRLDRAGVIGGCGEVRLVYRLAYSIETKQSVIFSRLPMTISLELQTVASRLESCRDAARRWFFPRRLQGYGLAQWLVSTEGPLFSDQRAPAALRRVAINLQSVRWPSTVRPDLGGHAEYVLRAFIDDGAGRLVPAPLENTPDVARLARDKALLAELLAFLKTPDHFAAIDGATVSFPEKFSATKAVSVTPRGWARQKNRPFSLIVPEGDLRDLQLSGALHIKSPAAFLRRLDDLTCPGCHQARGVAGFHFLGADGDAASAHNALASSFSPHFERDQPRRRAILHALRDGRPPSYVRPLAERADRSDAGYGAHCGLGDPGFADWTCDAGYRCERFDAASGDATVGICLPDDAGSAGDPCEMGPIAPSADGHRDRVPRARRTACHAGAACNTNAVGFPGGMCTPACGADDAAVACGRIAILDAFNACLARSQGFESCIAQHSSPAALRRCTVDNPCRDDYVCAGSRASGVCIPPYFIFQLRVDGHAVPTLL